MSELIEFSKERTIGQTISFAFMIFRVNARNFWKGMAAGVLPWIIAAGICFTPFIISYINGNKTDWDAFILLLLLAIALYAFGFLVLNTYVNEYVIAVKNDTVNQKPHYKAILKATYKAVPVNIINFFLLTIIFVMMSSVVSIIQYFFLIFIFLGAATGSIIIIGIGYVICTLAVYVAVSYVSTCTGPIIFICQYEKVNFFKGLAINFSYVHARKGFWAGILISFFGLLLMYIISLNISQPIWIVFGIVEYNSGALSSGGSDKILMIVGLIYLTLAVTWPLSSFIMMIIFGANYFNQKERALGAGLNERIHKIGELKDYDSSKLEADF
jgi:hypothetical protein